MTRSQQKIIEVPFGFDSHNHISLSILLAQAHNVTGWDMKDQLLDLIASLPKDQISLVVGWQSNLIPFTAEDLEGMPAVIVINYCLHGFVASPKAWSVCQAAGLTLSGSDPRSLERDLFRNVITFWRRHSPLQGVELDAVAAHFIKGLKKQGLYGACDMLQLYPERVREWAQANDFQITWYNDHSGASHLKLFADGAVGARTAAVSQPMHGDFCPVLTYSDSELLSIFDDCVQGGSEVAVHAIGDLAIEQVLQAYREVGAGFKLRLEHVQFITKKQARQAKEMGVTLSMQPNFSLDSTIYADRLPLALRKGNNPFRMLIDEAFFEPGEDLLFGSDGMPTGMAEAVRCALFPPYEEQVLTLQELYRGYHASHDKGTLLLEVDDEERSVKAVEQ